MPTIRIEGEDAPVDYARVKDAVVKIGDCFFWRHDGQRIQWVTNKAGKKRAFRMNSPLIVSNGATGNKMLKSEAILTEDGIWLDPSSEDVVKIGNKYHRRVFCTSINGAWYLKSDEAVMRCAFTNKYFLKANGISLDAKLYDNAIVSPETKTVTDYLGRTVRAEDCRRVWNLETEQWVHYPVNVCSAANKLCNGNTVDIVYDFQDKTNPQEGRLEQRKVFRDQLTKIGIAQITFPSGDLLSVPATRRTFFEEQIATYIMPRYLSKQDEIRTKINANYDDLDENENTAKTFKHVAKPFDGKRDLHRASSFGTPIESKNHFNKTGGLEYSYGVEIETSEGLLSAERVEQLGVLQVGDRSVGSAEYVTSPLRGDAGITHLKELAEILNNYTLVDNRCAIHVHVGSLVRKGEPKQTPSFSQQMLINAIRLGTIIEPELFACMPPSRKPTLYHCHSIMRWKDISKTNYNKYMGAYIFGEKEWWLAPTDHCPTKLFDFEPYKLDGRHFNDTTTVGTWANGRYKWLNLIPSYLARPNKTLEIRIFPGTTVFEKIYMYVLFSLAFVYVADNCPKIIKPGLTIEDMLTAAFGDTPLKNRVVDFFEERKKKFKRTKIYPSLDLPFLKGI